MKFTSAAIQKVAEGGLLRLRHALPRASKANGNHRTIVYHFTALPWSLIRLAAFSARTMLMCAHAGRVSISAEALVEVDHLTPIIPSVDVAHGAANRAAEMGADVTPIPVRQVLQRKAATMATELPFGRPDAIDEHCLKPGIAIDGAFPIAKPASRFSAPR
jgi:hypothetical protein